MSSWKKHVVQKGSQYFYRNFPILGMPDEKRAVKYFSLNPFLPDKKNRCPLACAYCICHEDDDWHHHPEQFDGLDLPGQLLEFALELILETDQGKSGFPISLCDYSDPFIEAHQQRVLDIITALGKQNATNMIYITTKYHPGYDYLLQLKGLIDKYPKLRPTLFVSLPPLKSGYEVVSIERRVQLIKDLVSLNIPCTWYLRPLTKEWFDEDLMWKLTRELLPVVPDHIILSGLVMTDTISQELKNNGLMVPEWPSDQAGIKQNLDPEFEKHLRHILTTVAEEQAQTLGPVMSHRLCGTNGNHGYGCLICGKSDRYCQLFQIHHYGKEVGSIENAEKTFIPIKTIDTGSKDNT